MRPSILKTYLFFIVFFVVFFGFSQVNEEPFIMPDSLKRISTKELANRCSNSYPDTILYKYYAKAYMWRARSEGDTIKLANAYIFLSGSSSKDIIRLRYIDSLIDFTKNLKNIQFPASSYWLKASYFHKKGDYIQTLNNYMLAYKHADINNNIKLKYYVKHSIGLLKQNLGDHKEALQIFKECLYFYENQIIKRNELKEGYKMDYVTNLRSLADAYIKNGILDTADIIIKKGIYESLDNNILWHYNYFVLMAGMNQYTYENYYTAKDSITKALNFFSNDITQDEPTIELCYLNLGKINIKLNLEKKAINYFKLLDSLVEESSEVIPEARESYEYLIDHFNKNKDYKNELRYVKKLLKVDSLLYKNHKYLAKEIVKKYETPELLKTKEILINNLQAKNQKSYIGLFVLGFLSLFLSISFIYSQKKQQLYKKRFNEIINDRRSKRGRKLERSSQKLEGISREVIKKIRLGLDAFEKERLFLDNKMALNNLSKHLNTNSNYLSKVINFYEKKNFSTYVNDLRIEYAIEQLKTNPQFRLYSIKGIAYETGFNSVESFSKAFYKRTGLYPSYFIKQLEKTSQENIKTPHSEVSLGKELHP